MLFTDVSSERAVRAFGKAGFKVIAQSKHIRIITTTPNTLDIFINIISKHKPKSQSVFDYLLLATMLDNGVDGIYTANSKDFKHFKDITVTNPLS